MNLHHFSHIHLYTNSLKNTSVYVILYEIRHNNIDNRSEIICNLMYLCM
jgi:hypothetical protein